MTFNRRQILTVTAAALSVAVIACEQKAAIQELAAPTNHIVEIRGFEFTPTALSVRPGDTITFTNFDIAPHTATADDQSWDTGLLKKDQSATIDITADMMASYFCAFHPQMKANLIIATAN